MSDILKEKAEREQKEALKKAQENAKAILALFDDKTYQETFSAIEVAKNTLMQSAQQYIVNKDLKEMYSEEKK